MQAGLALCEWAWRAHMRSVTLERGGDLISCLFSLPRTQSGSSARLVNVWLTSRASPGAVSEVQGPIVRRHRRHMSDLKAVLLAPGRVSPHAGRDFF